jgi:hypothetical protein
MNITTSIRRTVPATACALAAALLAAAQASAFTNPMGDYNGFGDPANDFRDNVELGDLSTCTSQFSGRVTRDAGPGMGGDIGMNQIVFARCSNSVSVTVNPTTTVLTYTAAATATVSLLDLDVTTARGTCRYVGALDNGALSRGITSLDGSLDRRAGDCGTPASLRVAATYHVVDILGYPMVL